MIQPESIALRYMNKTAEEGEFSNAFGIPDNGEFMIEITQSPKKTRTEHITLFAFPLHNGSSGSLHEFEVPSVGNLGSIKEYITDYFIDLAHEAMTAGWKINKLTGERQSQEFGPQKTFYIKVGEQDRQANVPVTLYMHLREHWEPLFEFKVPATLNSKSIKTKVTRYFIRLSHSVQSITMINRTAALKTASKWVYLGPFGRRSPEFGGGYYISVVPDGDAEGFVDIELHHKYGNKDITLHGFTAMESISNADVKKRISQYFEAIAKASLQVSES